MNKNEHSMSRRLAGLWSILLFGFLGHTETISSGERRAGTILSGHTNLYTFTAEAGNGIVLRVGTTNVVPRIDLYGPAETLLRSAFTASSLNRDAVLYLQITNSGTFTVALSSYYAGGTGGYGLHLARVPSSIEVPAGDEGGPVANGVQQAGVTSLGDLDLWSFAANAGDSVQLRMGATGFVPRIDLYAPDGTLVDSAFTASSLNRDAWLSVRLASSGTFTAVVSGYYLGSVGTYSLSLARIPASFDVSPGDEGGPVANGAQQAGVTSLGDLDLWSFAANAGDSVQLRVGATGFVPRIDLYAPDGTLVGSAFTASSLNRDAWLSVRLASSGTFTAVVGGHYLGSAGTYSLSLARIPASFDVSPGDEGGPLANGLLQTGTLDLGDLDLWTFEANAGENLRLRMGATGFVPRIDLYAPDGTLVDSAFTASSLNRDALLWLQVTNSGIFTAVLSSYYLGGGGTYSLTLAHGPGQVFASPGDEGGSMINGITYAGTNSLGDQDVWSFYGTVGDSNVFRIGTIGFTPWLVLYGPSGGLVAESFTASTLNRTNHLAYVVTNAGTYTLVSSAYYLGQSGTYGLKQSRVPPDLVLPGTQILDEGGVLNAPISAADPDDPAKSLTFLLLSAPAGVTLTTLGTTNAVLSWTTTEADGPSTNLIVASVTDVVNGRSFTRTNGFTVIVNEVNASPRWTPPADQSIDELTALNFQAFGLDEDLPPNPLVYSLNSPPAGMTIDPDTGAITWEPAEAHGPSTNLISIVVTDTNPWAVNEEHLRATNGFYVTVREVNTPPRLAVPPSQFVDEQAPFSAAVTAFDDDLPANPLTFSLLAPPAGMTIDPASGSIAWTPTEAQGPSTNLIRVVVTDSNPSASTAQTLSATNSFTLTVTESNSAPVLQSILDGAAHYGGVISIQARALDADLPTNVLTFSLDAAPTDMTINAADGLITWTPGLAQVGTNVITVRITDNGQPPLSDVTTFRMVVTGHPSHLAIQGLPGRLTQLNITGNVGLSYELQFSSDLVEWDSLIRFNLSTSPYSYIDPGSAAASNRFYRLKLDSP